MEKMNFIIMDSMKHIKIMSEYEVYIKLRGKIPKDIGKLINFREKEIIYLC